jgi:hypothetical protein
VQYAWAHGWLANSASAGAGCYHQCWMFRFGAVTPTYGAKARQAGWHGCTYLAGLHLLLPCALVAAAGSTVGGLRRIQLCGTTHAAACWKHMLWQGPPKPHTMMHSDVSFLMRTCTGLDIVSLALLLFVLVSTVGSAGS